MSQSKDQGRYARMLAFWALVLLVAYGCFHNGGLVSVLDRVMGESNAILIDPFPLLDTLKISTCIAIGVLVATSLLILAMLRRPKIAATLTETESEMQKVTWPTWGEAWHGTMAVCVMVLVLFVFLSLVDLLFIQAMVMLMGGGGA